MFRPLFFKEYKTCDSPVCLIFQLEEGLTKSKKKKIKKKRKKQRDIIEQQMKDVEGDLGLESLGLDTSARSAMEVLWPMIKVMFFLSVFLNVC